MKMVSVSRTGLLLLLGGLFGRRLFSNGLLHRLFGGELLGRLFCGGFFYGHVKSPLSSAAAEGKKLMISM
ncbi:MAG TPA: hypothetical protein VHY22_08505 [Chthoniobacteraceae bacterium]|nr:hypothetical protein [Chthoniobacteraceae bacterium]